MLKMYFKTSYNRNGKNVLQNSIDFLGDGLLWHCSHLFMTHKETLLQDFLETTKRMLRENLEERIQHFPSDFEANCHVHCPVNKTN